MSRSRTPLVLGLALAGGAGYYLYSAGGSPKVAEKNFENDLKYARDRASGKADEVRTDAEKFGAETGAKVDTAIAKAQSEYNRATANARDAARDAQANVQKHVEDARTSVNKSIDAFDKKVEDTASKTKSNVSSWFGGK
ncbi:hypothetical protein SEUCBS139899_000225 [Sporothrix eucalyptigena]|uniref:Calcofluor white hypersensitive protein n=1 Tax=Sporothrix eucalyptigena TaxID=1812306 RepID=A0ABP0BLP4_9PEZI